MGRGAKNHRFHRSAQVDPGLTPESDPDRRAGRDRRDPARAAQYQGIERRQGPRREADLPTPLWRRPWGLAAAIGLGVVAGLIFNELETPPAASPAAVVEASIDPDALATVEALRDEAEALTVAEVALDERAHERWMPRVANIEAAIEDPATPEPIRNELVATISALECVGVLEASPRAHDTTCVTIAR